MYNSVDICIFANSHTKMVLSRRFKYIIRILVWSIIGFHLILGILLNIPSVQGKLASLVSDELRKVLQTEITIGHVDVQLFNRIIIKDILLEDQQGEDLLKVDRLSARFEWSPLLDGKIVINSVQLLGFSIQLNKETPESVPNFQFVLDAFAAKDTLKEPTNLDLRINSVFINRGQLTYDVLSAPETPGKFNASHIGIDDLSASISLKALRNDSLHVIVRRMGFEEQSGFILKKLALKVLADNNHLDVNDFKLDLSTTSLTLDSLKVRFDSLPNLWRMTDDVRYQGSMQGSILLKDLAPIVPVLKGLNQPLQMQLKMKGEGKQVQLPSLSLVDGKYIAINGNVTLSDWDSPRDMFLKGQLKNLSVNQSGIEYLMTNLTGNVPPILQRLEHLEFQGVADGYLHDLHVDGLLQSAVGSLDANLVVHQDENKNASYTGVVESTDIDLGRLLGDDKWGHTSFNLALEGFNYHQKYPESYIKGVISSLDYSNYCYENITLDGIYKDGGFNGRLALDDSNASVIIDGTFNVAQDVPNFNLRATVRNFRPNELHLSDKYIDSDISLDLMADFTGKSIDDINGRILLDNLILRAPENQGYFLDNLTITAGNVAGEKELHIESPFMTALVRGDYSYQTLPASILQTVQRYVPSIIALKDDKVVPHNNFKFDIKLNDAELFKKVFFVPLDIHMPVSLKGYFNDREEKLRLEGYFPNLTYNGTRYESGTLICENPSNQFDCQLRGSMLMKSGAMLNLSLDAQAEKDRLKTILNWGNNTDITYGGQFSAITYFSKTEGKSPILQADIDILPTTVVMNDTIWNIRKSHIAVDSGRVYVDNFLFERPGQHLRVDGKITKEATDSCVIDLKNIDVQYVLDIVKFDDVEFGGLATGKVLLKNILQQPDMKTHLNVHNFAVNKGIMGEADIKGVWDNDLPGIRLEARMEEENLSTTRVTGFVSPKLKALDLHIEADSTNLDLLAPYFEGIFSDLDARANGFVRLHGGFKTLDFEGGVRVNLDAKVDILNTYLQLHNDSVYLSAGEIALRNARLYDREGNTGRVTGALRHTHLKNMMYHFDIDGDNLLMYHTTDPGDMLFYGKVYGTGHITLDGGNNAMNVDANLTTGQNTTFTYVTGLTTEATSNQFITFVDKTPKRIQDSIRTEFYHYTDANIVKKDRRWIFGLVC